MDEAPNPMVTLFNTFDVMTSNSLMQIICNIPDKSMIPVQIMIYRRNIW